MRNRNECNKKWCDNLHLGLSKEFCIGLQSEIVMEKWDEMEIGGIKKDGTHGANNEVWNLIVTHTKRFTEKNHIYFSVESHDFKNIYRQKNAH